MRLSTTILLEETGGTLPSVDINNSAELLDIMDGYIDPGEK
jgi:hypothetical protein